MGSMAREYFGAETELIFALGLEILGHFFDDLTKNREDILRLQRKISLNRLKQGKLKRKLRKFRTRSIFRGTRGGHGDESGRSGQRYGSHAATPGDSTPTAPQTRGRRPHDRMEIVPNNAPPLNPLDDLITTDSPRLYDSHERRVSMRLRAGQAPNASTSDLSNSKQANASGAAMAPPSQAAGQAVPPRRGSGSKDPPRLKK